MSHLAALKGIDSPLSKSDHFFTPGELLADLHAELCFTLDVASHPEAPSNALIGRAYCWPERDGLKEPWAGERIWCNPPYSNISPWVARAWEVASICPVIAMLLPANKTEQPWWQRAIEPFRDRRPEPGQRFLVETRFIAGRQAFGMPAAVRAEINAERLAKGKKPLKGDECGTFASVLVIWRAL